MTESITSACSDQRGTTTAGADVDQQAEHLASEASECRIVGRSLAIQRMLHLVTVVAPTDSTVLIEGETGSGKELVARTVCHLSGRRRKAFIKLNCRPCRRDSSRASSSDTRRAPSRGPPHSGAVGSSWRTEELSASTRSATYRSSSSGRYCAFFRSRSSSAWAAHARFEQTSASWRRPTVTWRRSEERRV